MDLDSVEFSAFIHAIPAKDIMALSLYRGNDDPRYRGAIKILAQV